MKKATKTQLKYRKLGHAFEAGQGGLCHLCGLLNDPSTALLHSDDKRGIVLDDAPAPTTSEPAKDLPTSNTPTEKSAKTKRIVAGSKEAALSELSTELRSLVHQLVDPLYDRVAGIETAKAIESARVPLIFSAINRAMEAIRPLAKTESNPDQGFDFRRIDVILAEIQPILVASKLFYTPVAIIASEQIDRPVRLASGEAWVNIFTRVTVRYRVYCTIDGSSIDVEAMGEGVSEFQHSTAAAQTMAEKTMLCDLFCIPVYGADDPEAETSERSSPASSPDEFPTGPAPQSGELFGNIDAPAETTPKKKRGKRTDEPQTVAVAGAALDAPAVVEDKPLPGGLRKILEAGMVAHGVTEAILFEQFKVKTWEDLKAGQMNDLNAWVNGYVKEA